MTEELPICSFCAWQGVLVDSRAGEEEGYMRSGCAVSTVQPLLNKSKLDYGGVVGSQACWHSPIISAFQEADTGDHKFKPTWATY